MKPELREALIVALWIVPVALLANLAGFLFLMTFERSTNPFVGYAGYMAIPIVIGFGAFAIVLRSRPRAKSIWLALTARPASLYIFLMLIAWWLGAGFRSSGFELVAPIAVAPIVATLAGVFAVVMRARPISTL